MLPTANIINAMMRGVESHMQLTFSRSKTLNDKVNAKSTLNNDFNDVIAHFDTIMRNDASLSEKGREQAISDLSDVIRQMKETCAMSIEIGCGDKASKLIGNNAHGAIGELVKKKAEYINFQIKDKRTNKVWRNVPQLAQLIVRRAQEVK